MKKLFIASSVYQLFNAINITNQYNDFNNTSILLLETTDDGRFSSCFDTNILKNLFENIFLIKYKIKRNKCNKLLYVLQMIFDKSICGNYINQKYDEVYIPGTEIISKVLAYKLLKKDSKLYYYEDGFGSYNSVLNPNTKKRNDAIFKLLYGYTPLEKCEGLYVYEPNIVNNEAGVFLNKINKIIRNKEYIFNYKDLCQGEVIDFKKKFIFLSSWFENEDYYEFQNKMITQLASTVGQSNCCVKPHPNEWKTISHLKDVDYIKSTASFEISNYYYDYSDNIFVSLYSTASLTPRLVYNDNPTIIFLYKILEKEFGVDLGINKSMKRLASIYQDETKVFFPSTVEQFVDILKKLI